MDSVKEILLTEEFVQLQNDFKKRYGYSCDKDLPIELLSEFSKEIAEQLVNKIFNNGNKV